jgi:fumarate hydratase subunit beta
VAKVKDKAKMIRLQLPLSEKDTRGLKAGDEVLISGTIVTGRDSAHKWMVEKKPAFLKKVLEGSFIYHCGPIVEKLTNGKYHVVSAGPTTSMREEPYQSEVIEMYGLCGIIGKGGMGKNTLDALKKFGAVYASATGGIAVALADAIKEVKDVYMLEEFGAPEAMWVLEIKDFPAIISMDSHGNSLHKDVLKKSTVAMEKFQK